MFFYLQKKSFFISFIITILFVNFSFANSLTLQNSNKSKPFIHLTKISTDDQFQVINKISKNPLCVKIVDSLGNPVANIPVFFEKVIIPENALGVKLSLDTVYTDQLGIAKTSLIFGNKSGEYVFMARCPEMIEDIILFKLYAYPTNWLFFLFTGLLGGLAIFLLGINRMGKGLQQTAGDRLRNILKSLTNNPVVAASSGIFIAMILQSSGATAAMLVNFVNAGLMTFAQTIWVLFGAGIGASIIAQLIAFKLTDYALLMLAIGTFAYFFIKSDFIKNLGETLLGIGMLFFGLYIMSEAFYPLENYKPFLYALSQLQNPFLGLLTGFVLTALVQSSGAFIGILIMLSIHGMIGLEAAIPLVFGANIGTSISGLLATINTNREAHKVAISLTVIKIIGVFIFIWWIPSFTKMILYISNDFHFIKYTSNARILATPRQIANAHTFFNVALAVIGLPFTNKLINLIDRLVPRKTYTEEETFKLKFLDDALLSTPTLAIGVAKKETLRMGQTIENMVKECMLPFTERNKEIINEIMYSEKKVQFLFNKINPYLIKLSRENIPGKGLDEVFLIMFTIKELEQINNIISEKISVEAKQWFSLKTEFSDEGKKELIRYYEITVEQMNRAIEAFAEMNIHEARILKKKFERGSVIAREFELNHYMRLKNEIKESLETSNLHIELINILKMINEHATNIAKLLLERIEKNAN